MKKGFLNGFNTMFAPAALAVAILAFSPAAALAAEHGGRGGRGGGFGGGHAYSAPRGNFNGGRAYSAPRGNFNGGRAYNGGHYYSNGGRYYSGRGYYGGRGWYGPGVGFGFGVGVYPGYAYPAYGYAAPAYGYGYAPPAAACNPAGFYDQAGNWQYYQGCMPPQPPPNGGQNYDGPPPNDPNF